jgi:hypothetical protein
MAPVTRLPDPDPAAAFDPAAEMRALAGRLVAATRENPANTALARECRAVLLVLMGQGDPDEDAAWQTFIDGLSTPTRSEPGPCG